MRVLVCGSRHFNDWDLLEKTLCDIHAEGGHPYKNEITDLIHGGARGADTLAGVWASKHYGFSGQGIKVHKFPADWNKHDKAAGPIRNSQMLKEGKPDLVVAFMFKDSRGTKNMVEQATKAGVEVKVIHCE